MASIRTQLLPTPCGSSTRKGMILASGAASATRPATCVPWPYGPQARASVFGVEQVGRTSLESSGESRVASVDARVEHRDDHPRTLRDLVRFVQTHLRRCPLRRVLPLPADAPRKTDAPGEADAPRKPAAFRRA